MSVNNTQTARGEQAKQQLLEAALEIFGKSGLTGATTREIALRAQQNIAAIAYYFGSKEGLYQAVAQYITDTIKKEFTHLFKEIDDFFSSSTTGSPENILRLIHEGFLGVNRLMIEKESINISRIMAREQLAPTDAYTLIHEQALAPLHNRLNKLIASYIAPMNISSLPCCMPMHSWEKFSLSEWQGKPYYVKQAGIILGQKNIN